MCSFKSMTHSLFDTVSDLKVNLNRMWSVQRWRQVNKVLVLMKPAAEGLTESLLTLWKRLCVCADSALRNTKHWVMLRCIKAASSHRCESSPPPSAQSSTSTTRQHVRHRHEHDEQGKSQHASLLPNLHRQRWERWITHMSEDDVIWKSRRAEGTLEFIKFASN